MNEGSFSKEITILQLPSLIEIESTKAQAGSPIDIQARVLDQNNNIMSGNITITLFTPSNNQSFIRMISSGENISFLLPDNAEIGNWKIEAISREISAEKPFSVGENEKISKTLEGDILTVKNIGNIYFNKTITIDFSINGTNFSQAVLIELSQEQEQKLQLSAPDGEYDLTIENSSFKRIALTGDAISIKNISEGMQAKYPIIAILLFVGIILTLFLVSQKRIRQDISSLNQTFSKEMDEKRVIKVKLSTTENEKNEIKHLFEKYTDKSTVELIQSKNIMGQKKEVTALFVDMRGFSEMTEKLDEKILDVLNEYFKIVTETVYQNQGIVNHLEADEVFALFNATKEQQDHTIKAVRAAIKIMRDLENYNKNHENKINVGIGINTGKAIVGRIGSDKIMKFTSIGDTINIAQKIEEKARNKIFITKAVYEKVKDFVKTRRVGISEISGKPVELFEVEF